MTIVRMTELAGVSRATYYRFDPEAAPAVADVDALRMALAKRATTRG